jgi:hypothetical protein
MPYKLWSVIVALLLRGMRFFVPVFIVATLAVVSFAKQPPPLWPQITLVSCPAIGQPRDPNQRKWKHGETEQNDFWTAVRTKELREGAELLAKFTEKYPDSDYREPALFGEWGAYVSLEDGSAQAHVAELMLKLPTAEATIRAVTFVTLASVMSPYVRTDDPQREQKLADLDRWVQCGVEAFAAEVKPANMTEDAFKKNRQYEESVLDRTAGFVAFSRGDYSLADSKLEQARNLNSQDALTYLWLATTEFLSPTPDSNEGIFDLARFATLTPASPGSAPEVREASSRFLRQMYKIVHGSEKGLPDVMKLAESNTIPPPGFNVLPPPKVKHHYGSAIVAAAVVGLLIYGVAAHPDVMEALGQSLGQSQEKERKLMIFGGPDHRIYLGCLSCQEAALDSVLNELGQYGSPYRPESIWNHYQQFGSPYSPYSACNDLATDPPVIVDQDGTAYGRLTLNRNSPKIGAGARFYDWLASAVCRE